MDNNFRKGFEKAAVFGLIGKGISKMVTTGMPKIFRAATMKNGKFSVGKGLTSAFVGSEVVGTAGRAMDDTHKLMRI